MKKEKILFIVGGANGTGKSTIAYEYSKIHKINYLGADDILKELENTGKRKSEIEAGKIFFNRLEEILKKNNSILIESTLSGLGLLNRILDFKKAGYIISIVFVFLDSIDLCKKRVKIRVKKGGHNVPPADIERRYNRCHKNFWEKYRFIADSWQLLYNGKERPVEVAVDENAYFTILDEEYFKKFMGNV